MDSCLIFPPGASQLASAWASTIQLGSWLMADPGPDYGAKGLIESVKAQNALRDGGSFTYRRGVIRKMALPLMINTPSPAMWESSLRKAVTPGAIVAIQPEGVPSAQAVYFDIIDGRWEPDYNIFHNRVGVRKGTLYLDTQPWGYWPTEIVLASSGLVSASMGCFGQLAVNGASVIGDVPPLAHITIAPFSNGSTYAGLVFGGNATFGVDMLAFSLSAKPSFSPFLPAGSGFIALSGPFTVATRTGDKYAPGSQVIQIITPSLNGGTPTIGQVARWPATSYTGRYRAFLLAKMSPSAAPPVRAILDVDTGAGAALASSNQVATVYAVVPTAFGNGTVFSPSPAHSIYDMGEYTLPAFASGLSAPQQLRLWFSVGSSNPVTISMAGLYLLPVDGAAGIQTRGLVVPSIYAWVGANQGALECNSQQVEGLVTAWIPGVGASGIPYANLLPYYRGVAPRIGASTSQLVWLMGDRVVDNSGNGFAATGPVLNSSFWTTRLASVSYRPTFQFLAGG